MRSVETKKKSLTNYANIIKEKGVTILFPDINKSNKHMDIYNFENNIISTGFMAIKGLAEGTIDNIIEERAKNGDFTSFEDFLERMVAYNIDKKAMTALIGSGAFDCFTKNQERLLSIVNDRLDYMKVVKNYIQSEAGTQKTFYDFERFNDTLKYLSEEPDNNGYDLYERLSMLCEYNNVGIHGDIMKSYTNIQHEFEISPRQRDPERIEKKGIVTGFLEDTFELSKSGKAYLVNMTGFDGEKYRLIVVKSKAEDVIGDYSQYKKGMVIDVVGTFSFPNLDLEDDNEDEEENSKKKSTEVTVFPNKVTVKIIENPYVKNEIIIDLDDNVRDRQEVLDYFGVTNMQELVKKVFSDIEMKDKCAEEKLSKNIKVKYNNKMFTLNKDVILPMDIIKKLGCSYTFN